MLCLVLVLLCVTVNAQRGYDLPDLCLCNGEGQNVSVLACTFRTSKRIPMEDCGSQIVVKDGVTLQKGPLAENPGNMTCTCFLKIPVFPNITGLVNLLVSNADWAVLYRNGQFDPSRVVDRYSELEYLYGRNAEMLMVYPGPEGSFSSTLRRSDAHDASGQTFWYGFDPLADALW